MATTTNTSILITLLVLISTTTSKAQSNTPVCVSNLVPCASFMSGTGKPPQSCCGPLKTAITTQLDCLCGLYNTPGLLQSLNVNLTQALNIPSRCGIDGASLSECLKVGGSAPSPAGTTAPTGSPKNDNGVGKMSGFGISGLLLAMSFVAMLVC